MVRQVRLLRLLLGQALVQAHEPQGGGDVVGQGRLPGQPLVQAQEQPQGAGDVVGQARLPGQVLVQAQARDEQARPVPLGQVREPWEQVQARDAQPVRVLEQAPCRHHQRLWWWWSSSWRWQ